MSRAFITPLHEGDPERQIKSKASEELIIKNILNEIKNQYYKKFFTEYFTNHLPLKKNFGIDQFLKHFEGELTKRSLPTNIGDLENILLFIEEAHKIYKKANPDIGTKSSSLEKFDSIIKKSKSIILYIIATKLILQIGIDTTSDSNPLYQSLSKLCDSIHDSTSTKESAQPLILNQNKEKAESGEILQTLETLNSHTDESLKKFFSFAESSQIGKLEKSIQALSDLFKNNIRGKGEEVKLFKEILLKISNQKRRVLEAEEGQFSNIYRFTDSSLYRGSNESNSSTNSSASDSRTTNSANNTSISAQESTTTDFCPPHLDNSPDTYVLGKSNSSAVNYSLYDSSDNSIFLCDNYSNLLHNSGKSNSPVLDYSYFDHENHSELEYDNNPIARTIYLSPVSNQNSSPRYYPDLPSNKIFSDQQEPASVKSVYDVLKETNKNSETIKNNQNSSWYNNKKLLKALKKVANCDFDTLKEALNSSENRENSLIKDLGLTSGDLSVLDAIDELRDTKRANDSFAAKNSKRTNLEEFLSLIPKEKNDRNKFFAFEKNEVVTLHITEPSNGPKNARARKLEKNILIRT